MDDSSFAEAVDVCGRPILVKSSDLELIDKLKGMNRVQLEDFALKIGFTVDDLEPFTVNGYGETVKSMNEKLILAIRSHIAGNMIEI